MGKLKMNNRDKEARKQKRLEALGSNHPVCVICGEGDWRCLELHHIAGQAYGDELVPVCRNCHRKLSDDQKDHPQCVGDSSQLESIGHHLLGLADMHDLQAETLRQSGQHLIQTAKDGSK